MLSTKHVSLQSMGLNTQHTISQSVLLLKVPSVKENKNLKYCTLPKGIKTLWNNWLIKFFPPSDFLLTCSSRYSVFNEFRSVCPHFGGLYPESSLNLPEAFPWSRQQQQGGGWQWGRDSSRMLFICAYDSIYTCLDHPRREAPEGRLELVWNKNNSGLIFPYKRPSGRERSKTI